MTQTTRGSIAKEDQWNIEALYPSFDAWEADFSAIASPQGEKWMGLATLRDHLGKDAACLHKVLQLYFDTLRALEKLLTYAHLRHDEDITEEAAKNCYERILSLYHEFRQDSSWIEPEILKLSPETLKSLKSAPELATYSFHLDRLLHLKDHTLSSDGEKLMALASAPLQAAYKTFSALNNADLSFPPAVDENGKECALSHGLYQFYLHQNDRKLRQSAFKVYHDSFAAFENTLSEVLSGTVQAHLFEARARNYSSCLEGALKHNNIPTQVYHALCQAVDAGLPALHRYIALKRSILGYEKLHAYDLYAPLAQGIDQKFDYDEAQNLVVASVAPLGKEYQATLKQGLLQERWVDRYENKNKRSGAYSSGCYDSFPYILMNYKGLLTDVFTLAHEAGHSMHSYLSRKSQPFHTSDYPIFVAEVASTFNEELLMQLLLAQASSKEERIGLLAQKAERIYATLFRQTLFAQFELMLHTHAENNVPLTPLLLKEEYSKLYARYFGPEFSVDKELEIEWARIPHFYYNFYVYQYATGISAAHALIERVIGGGDKEREDYLSFLKGGSSRYPIDLLQMAGVDMRTPKPVETTIKIFNELTQELEQLCLSSKD